MSKKIFVSGMAALVVMLFAGSVFAAEYVEQAATDTQSGEYWTKERMRNAKPMLKVLKGTPSDLNKPIVDEGPVGKAGSAKAGSLSQATEDQLIEMSGTFGAIDKESFDIRYSYPPPFQVFAVPAAWYTLVPYQQTGKVYFTMNGWSYVCSGASVGGSLVLTAGHCVNNGGSKGKAGTWATNWRFVPAYNNGNTPYGIWAAGSLVASSDWVRYGRLCRDWAFVVTKKNSGKKLSQVVGQLGIITGVSRYQLWTQLGYPAESSFTGEKMYQTDASYSGSDDPDACSPYTMAKGFGQNGGSSGGPWIVKYKPAVYGKNNYVNSVTSYIYESEPKQIFGPYFDAVTYRFWYANHFR
jgi:V8-like Glu-specific endopeptidase